MNRQRPLLIAMALILAAAAVGVWAYLKLPAGAVIPVHFSPHGEPNGFMLKTPGLAITPAIGAVVVLGLAFASRRAPNRKGLDASAEALGVVLIGVAAIFLVSEAAVVARAMDRNFDLIRWLFLAIGVLFVVVGNFLGKVRHNYLIGVRTPWTLRNERVWDKTHRFTGRLMVLGGVVLAASAVLAPGHDILIGVLVLAAAGPGVAGAIYSRLIYVKPAGA
jgi:uncharacterized membrane protein